MRKYNIYALLFTFFLAIQLQAQTNVETEKLVPADIDWNDLFGSAVAIDEDWALVAAEGQNNIGAVYIFKNNDGNWTQFDKITRDQTDAGVGFGKSVSLDGEYGIVGYWYANEYANASGCAYIIHYDNNIWTKQTKLLPDTGFYQDRFGNAVDIEGDYAVVGASHEARSGYYGAAYIFYNNNGTWELQQKLTASDAAFGDDFGYSVGISDHYIMIGARRVDDNGNNAGAVYIFERTGSTWQEIDKIYSSDSEGGIEFGHSLSMDGDFAIVGAPSAESVINAPFGYAYLFKNNDGYWEELARLTASNKQAGDEFGYAVSINCDRAVVGAWYSDDLGTSSGSAYVFVNNQGNWEEDTILLASDGGAFNLFGSAVGISCDNILVGEPHNNVNGDNTGTAYIFGEGSTGVETLMAPGIQLYPNPADKEVVVSIPAIGEKQILITDLSGKVLLQQSTWENMVKLNIHPFENGCYMVQIRTNEGLFVSKVIKQ